VLIAQGSSSASSYAARLERGESVKTLHLRSSGVTAAQCTAMLAAPEAASLTSLSFSYNEVGDAGATAVAQGAPAGLTELGLVGCGVGDAGGRELVAWLESARAGKMSMICVEGNDMSAEVQAAIRRAGASLGASTYV